MDSPVEVLRCRVVFLTSEIQLPRQLSVVFCTPTIRRRVYLTSTGTYPKSAGVCDPVGISNFPTRAYRNNTTSVVFCVFYGHIRKKYNSGYNPVSPSMKGTYGITRSCGIKFCMLPAQVALVKNSIGKLSNCRFHARPRNEFMISVTVVGVTNIM